MTNRNQLQRWAKTDLAPVDAPPRIPVVTTFRHMPPSPAATNRVEAEVQKLQRYYSRITHCHVVIVAPHRHHRLGRQYQVHLEITVPGGELVITHDPPARVRLITVPHLRKRDEIEGPHKDLYVVMREVFDAARRRLEDYVRRERGDVKRHVPAPDSAA